MADKRFGVRELIVLGSGTPTITSPSDLNLNANTVAISTDITIGAKIGLGNPVDYGSPGEVLTSNGSNSAPTWQGLSGVVQDKIQEDNTSAEVVDTGTDGHFKVLTEGTERFRIGPAGIATFINEIHGNGQRLGSLSSSGRFSGLYVTDGESYYGTNKFLTSSSTEFGLRAFANNSAYLKSNSGGGTSGDVYLQAGSATGGGYLIAKGTDSVELHHSGTSSKKLSTTGDGITVTGISSASEGFDFEVQSSGSLVTTNSVKTLNFTGTNNTITYDASTKTVDIDIDGSSGSGGGTVFSGTFTASAGSPSTLNTYAYDSAELVFEYTVFVKNGSDYQTQKLLVMRDGTTVDSTQYAVMYSNGLLVQLDATISGSNILLRATPGTGVSGSTTYKVKREVI